MNEVNTLIRSGLSDLQHQGLYCFTKWYIVELPDTLDTVTVLSLNASFRRVY